MPVPFKRSFLGEFRSPGRLRLSRRPVMPTLIPNFRLGNPVSGVPGGMNGEWTISDSDGLLRQSLAYAFPGGAWERAKSRAWDRFSTSLPELGNQSDFKTWHCDIENQLKSGFWNLIERTPFWVYFFLDLRNVISYRGVSRKIIVTDNWKNYKSVIRIWFMFICLKMFATRGFSLPNIVVLDIIQ